MCGRRAAEGAAEAGADGKVEVMEDK